MRWLGVDPRLDTLRGERGFRKLLRRMKFLSGAQRQRRVGRKAGQTVRFARETFA